MFTTHRCVGTNEFDANVFGAGATRLRTATGRLTPGRPKNNVPKEKRRIARLRRSRQSDLPLRGMVATLTLGPSGAIVLTPRRGNDKLAQGRASRRSRDAPPWVARPLQGPSPRRGTTRPIPRCDHEQLRTGCEWMASIRGLRRVKRIGHVPRNVGIRIVSTLGFSRL